MVRAITKEEFIANAVGRYGDYFDYSKMDWQGMKKTVTIGCPEHGEFSQRPSRHLDSVYGCPKCGSDNKERVGGGKDLAVRKADFITRSMAKYNGKFDYSRVEYRAHNIQVEIVCPDHGAFKQTPTTHLSSVIYGCPKCGDVAAGVAHVDTLEDFIRKSREIHGDIYDYSLVVYKTQREKVIIKCPKHGAFEQLPSNHKNYGCYQCAMEGTRLTQDEFVTRAVEIHSGIYDYSRALYVNGTTKLTIICPEHGEFEQTPRKHLAGAGCKLHRGSRGELIIANWLNENGINFSREKSFPDCKNVIVLRFDFYIPDMNLLIEYDGEQHFTPVEYYGGEAGLRRRQFNDAVKNNYAARNGIPLLRVKYDLSAAEIVVALTDFIMSN